MGFVDTLLGNSSAARIKKLRPTIKRINALEPTMQALSDSQLRAKTDEFRARLKKGETFDDILPEAFAVVREAAVRTIGQRHYDVQLIGGIVLHQGKIAEMKTGEGKTLVATLPSYLHALDGNGVHVVTVNDYLAKRDAQWMGKIHRFLGLTVGCIVRELEPNERRAAYNCDITYGTNNEFGFDYLRDNMVVYRDSMVQRKLNYAIVDEVDSILIDEARTPLIISGRGEESTDMYVRADRFVRKLERGENIEKTTRADMLFEGGGQKESGDYMVDVKARTAALTRQGQEKAEQYFGLENIADPANMEINHHILQALKAHALFQRDKDYVVQEGQVIIVDEFTGRLMIGRRYSDGLHQALEAKEGVKVESENKTLASITFQNYFRMYAGLAGMTGTAKTEEAEFQGIYNLDVIEIPTNRPLIRRDLNDVIYNTEKGKFKAVVDAIEKIHATGQPVLVGTISVEKSEYLSDMLTKRGIRHEVLNAKQHKREAEIVAQAGKFGNVTIATNMAGRGTDIVLGGNPEFLAKQELIRDGMDETLLEEAMNHTETTDEAVLEARRLYAETVKKHKLVTDAEHEKVVAAGGLYIIGTERHESRRIDNQLRGRAGRQGDPGVTCFYVSLEDELMQRFGADRAKSIMMKLSPDDDIAMDIGLLSKQIEAAQKRVEAHNYEMRKSVLQYDDVMNKQREIIYAQRRKVLMGEDITDSISQMIDEAALMKLETYCQSNIPPENWDIGGLASSIEELAGIRLDYEKLTEASKNHKTLEKFLLDEMHAAYEAKEKEIEAAGIDMREVERIRLLYAVDTHWMDHIDAMAQLRQGIGLRAIAHRDPIIEYRNEGSDMFDEMVIGIRELTVRTLYHTTVAAPQKREQVAKPTEPQPQEGKQPKRVASKPGRNDPCPCGSGKKYKNCCGA